MDDQEMMAVTAQGMMAKARQRIAESRATASTAEGMMEQAQQQIANIRETNSTLEIVKSLYGGMQQLGQRVDQISELLQVLMQEQQAIKAAFERPRSVSIGSIRKDVSGKIIGADIQTRLQ